MRIETNSRNRKELVKAVSELTGSDYRYAGPPTFCYIIGSYTVDRYGAITSETEENGEELRRFLMEKGFLEPQTDILEIQIPDGDMSEDVMKRLIFMLHSKQYLINKAVGEKCFSISEDLITQLQENELNGRVGFLSLLGESREKCKGLIFNEENVVFLFPRSEDPDRNSAYTQLAAGMVARAKESKRVSPAEQKPDNEKYYFRIWLIQLGFGGTAGKAVRKILMERLKGYAAFRTEEDAERFKTAQKARREALKAAIAEEGEVEQNAVSQ